MGDVKSGRSDIFVAVQGLGSWAEPTPDACPIIAVDVNQSQIRNQSMRKSSKSMLCRSEACLLNVEQQKLLPSSGGEEGALHDAVLQAVEADHGQPPACVLGRNPAACFKNFVSSCIMR